MIQTGFETRIKVQDIVSSQLPNFILDESPKTIDFLKQYYISQEYQGGPVDLADNLDPVAIFTYNYNEKFESLKSKRQKAEKKLIKDKKDVSYPSYNQLQDEVNEAKPELVFTIRDNKNNVVKKI